MEHLLCPATGPALHILGAGRSLATQVLPVCGSYAKSCESASWPGSPEEGTSGDIWRIIIPQDPKMCLGDINFGMSLWKHSSTHAVFINALLSAIVPGRRQLPQHPGAAPFLGRGRGRKRDSQTELPRGRRCLGGGDLHLGTRGLSVRSKPNSSQGGQAGMLVTCGQWLTHISTMRREVPVEPPEAPAPAEADHHLARTRPVSPAAHTTVTTHTTAPGNVCYAALCRHPD